MAICFLLLPLSNIHRVLLIRRGYVAFDVLPLLMDSHDHGKTREIRSAYYEASRSSNRTASVRREFFEL